MQADAANRPASRWLYIDDNAGDIMIVRAMLQEHCPYICVATAMQAVEAVELLQNPSEHPDVIMLDISIVPWTGAEGVALIRNLRPQTPIIVFSGRADETSVCESYAAGANCYVFKQSGLDDLIFVLKGIADYWCNVVSSAETAAPQVRPASPVPLADGRAALSPALHAVRSGPNL